MPALDIRALARATSVRCRRPGNADLLYASTDRADLTALAEALETQPDAIERTGVLLELLGSRPGPWSPAPSWESVPEHWLLATPFPVLFDALGEGSSDGRCAGAIRLFCSWSFRKRRNALRKKLPAEQRARLLALTGALADGGQRAAAIEAIGA